ncbi:hypothetical protein M2266_002529 [Streptomyces sp. SPB162]|nr:hypothetical protein [Streptomyces sp. SPB162]
MEYGPGAEPGGTDTRTGTTGAAARVTLGVGEEGHG